MGSVEGLSGISDDGFGNLGSGDQTEGAFSPVIPYPPSASPNTPAPVAAPSQGPASAPSQGPSAQSGCGYACQLSNPEMADSEATAALSGQPGLASVAALAPISMALLSLMF